MSSAPPTTAAPSLPKPRSAAAIAFHSALLNAAAVLPSRYGMPNFSAYASQSRSGRCLNIHNTEHASMIPSPTVTSQASGSIGTPSAAPSWGLKRSRPLVASKNHSGACRNVAVNRPSAPGSHMISWTE